MTYVEVVVEAEPNCPRCAKLLPRLKALCDDLDIPLIPKYYGTRSVAAHEENTAARTFSASWVERYGLPQHKRILGKIKPILDYMERTGAQTFPNIIIRWHDGLRVKEIVIRGFDPASPEVDQFFRNLRFLLSYLKQR